MLMLTEDAVEVIAMLSEAPGAEGLRISRADVPEPGEDAGLQIGLVDAPGRYDEVLDAGNAQVFLAPDTVDALSDKVLDADVEGRSVRFALLVQAPGADDAGGEGNGRLV